MPAFIDLTGKKFGKLTVIEKTKRPERAIKTLHTYWLCKCECGKEHIVSGSNLSSGEVLSCGCHWKNICRNESGQSSLNALFVSYRSKAKRRNISFEISKDIFAKITKENCFYCGIAPAMIVKRKRCFGTYIYNGIDRIDSSKGYTSNNIVPCCGICNKAKLDYSQEDFYSWIIRIHKNLIEKGLITI